MGPQTAHRRLMARVLYLSYNGLAEPIVQSQVLAYLRRLAALGYPAILLTFEKPQHIDRARFNRLRRQLSGWGIEWRWLRYHKRPAVPATLYDILRGILAGWRLAGRSGVEVVHARASIAGLMGWAVAALTRKPFLFDVRGVNAEEYVDGSGWSRSSLRYRVLRWLEHRMFRQAQAAVVLTEWTRGYFLEPLNGAAPRHAGKVRVIPCCVDAERFRRMPEAAAELGGRLGLQDRFVVTYIGTLGTWYLLEEMARFARLGRQHHPNLHFVVVTPTSAEQAWEALRRQGFTSRDALVAAASPEEVPAYLSLADAGLSFIKPSLSKRSSSPTKIGEYLACGLPVVATRGVGDVDWIAAQRVGVLVDEFSDAALTKAWEGVETLLKDREALRARCREAAVRELSLERAVSAYRTLYDRLVVTEAREEEA